MKYGQFFKWLKSGKNLFFNCIINSIRKDGCKNHMMCENMKNQPGIMKKNVFKGRKFRDTTQKSLDI